MSQVRTLPGAQNWLTLFKVKQMAVVYKGGTCQECGYHRCIDVLEFHHLDPKQKDFGNELLRSVKAVVVGSSPTLLLVGAKGDR